MSLRLKAALIMVSIVFVLTAASFLSNFTFTRRQMTEAMEQDLALALAIANDLISTRIRLLVADADTVAGRLLSIQPDENPEAVMASKLETYPEFVSLAVYDRHSGIVASYGKTFDTDFIRYENPYIQTAFAGIPVISTTHFSYPTGDLVMYVFVPMGEDLVLSATIPGTIFADMVSRYRLWQTGNIFIIDEEGAFIASYHPNLVQLRFNYISQARYEPDFKPASEFFQKMITSDYGAGTYYYAGSERFSVFKRITGSNTGWRIAVVVPLDESPEANLRRGLLLSSLLFLAIGVAVSFLVSGFAVKPFYKIEAQNKSLEELNKTVQAATEAKSNFLAKMSHEMRTPLNAVIGLSALSLEEEGLSVETRETLKKISNAGAILLSTVNDLLDISKIEAGKFELVPAEYDTSSMINDTITQNIMRRGEKPVEFALHIDENIPERLYGDDLRIKQILNNLLSNAFKYTEKGAVTLSISINNESINNEDLAAKNESGAPVRRADVLLCFSVRDTGIGIRPENIGRLFTDYGQVDIKLNRKVEGTGLGLSIAKMMTDMMAGSISVESEYGKGSLFTVILPQRIVSATAIGPDNVKRLKNFSYSARKLDLRLQQPYIKLPYARVLLVDDVPTNLDVAKGIMKPYGMRIDCVSGGQEAVDAIREGKVRYNAIFMDHMMPGIDGIEATRIIREEVGTEYAKNIPIIALTADAIVGSQEMFLSKGFQAYIPKPVEATRLDEVINQWVRDLEWEKSFAGISGLDMNKGIERFNGDRETYTQVLQSFAVNTRLFLEAVEVVNEGNLPDYIINVHGIKGSCRGICAELAGDKADALENAGKAGDLDFVGANNPAFIAEVSKLISDIENMLSRENAKKNKPKKDKPAAEVLLKLLLACEAYKIVDAEAAIKEMEGFEYESDDGLTIWLKENVELMNYLQVAERLRQCGDLTSYAKTAENKEQFE